MIPIIGVIIVYIITPIFDNINKPKPAITDKKIEEFVKNTNLPLSEKVGIIDVNKENKIQYFSVSYGGVSDCEMGCVTNHATGIKSGDKIGWIYLDNNYNVDTAKLKMYDFDQSDNYLYSDEFFLFMKSKGDGIYYGGFLSLLANDKDTPRDILLKIANGLTSYITPKPANNLVENPTVKNDREILSIIANLPVYQGDAYKQARTKAETLLK